MFVLWSKWISCWIHIILINRYTQNASKFWIHKFCLSIYMCTMTLTRTAPYIINKYFWTMTVLNALHFQWIEEKKLNLFQIHSCWRQKNICKHYGNLISITCSDFENKIEMGKNTKNKFLLNLVLTGYFQCSLIFPDDIHSFWLAVFVGLRMK